MAPSKYYTVLGGRNTKIALIVLNVFEIVFELVSIYSLHSARSPTLDNIPFWTEFGSPNVTFAQFIVNIARSFATLPLLGIPWIFLCLIFDFTGVSKDSTDVSVVVTFDILAVCSMFFAVHLIIATYWSLTSEDNENIQKVFFSKRKHANSSIVTQLFCLNVVRYSMSKTMGWVWAVTIISFILCNVSCVLTYLFVDWDAIKDKKKGMTRSRAESLVQSEISKAMLSQPSQLSQSSEPSQETSKTKETVVAIDVVQPLMSQETSESND